MIELILVPVDFSKTSEFAADYACELAERFGARVTLLHVFSAATISTPDAVYRPTMEQVMALAQHARAALHDLAARLARDGVQIDCVALEGRAPEMIVSVAEEARVDLIVMGTHGRRELAHGPLGSVAEQLLNTAPCPVLTVGRRYKQPLRRHA
jgi:nucleotide-binding universal stress UspA family protein